jgi:hypothetical protein
VDEDHTPAVLEEQGRMVKWLARVTDIPAQRLYDIRHRRSWWRDAEAEAISWPELADGQGESEGRA